MDTDIKKVLQDTFGEFPVFFLKFTGKEKFAEEFMNGRMYANTPKYFQELEISTGIRGQGDANELMYTMPCTGLKFYDFESKEFCFEIPKASGKIQYKNDLTIPMLCFMGFSISDMNIISCTDNQVVLSFPFTDDEYKNLKKAFGEYCVLFGAQTFIENLHRYSDNNNVSFILKKITYCESNYIDKAKAFFNGTSERFFYKDNDLSFQREYRLIFDMPLPADHYINIEPLNTDTTRPNARVLKSDQLKELCLCITYK